MAYSKTIYGLFQKYANEQPNQVALLSSDAPDTTFSELSECVNGALAELLTHRIGRNSRIGFLVPNRPTAGVAHLVACSTGISVPLNPAMTPYELLDEIRELRIEGILVGEGLTDDLFEAATVSGIRVIPIHRTGKTGLFTISSGDSAVLGDSDAPEPDDIALLLRTSGTTSTPKIVPQSNSNRYATLTRSRHGLALSPSDRCLNMMPLHHTQGLNAEFLAPLLNGASVAFETFDPANIVNRVARYQPTWFNLVPSMHEAVLAALGDAQGVLKDYNLRYVRSSSAKLTTHLRKRLEVAYGVPIVESYGSSETSNIAATGLTPSDTRDGSVGRPVHEDVMVADPAGNRLHTGVQGEICVAGPTVITGYENNPEANAASFRDGWYRTGDEGYFDEDGFLYITGRVQEVVNRGGEKFSLTEIDSVLAGADGVESGAAFMAPHPQLGHEIYAAVVLSPGSVATPATVRSSLAKQLSWARVPKQVFIVSELPVNSTGKVVREKLVEILIDPAW